MDTTIAVYSIMLMSEHGATCDSEDPRQHYIPNRFVFFFK